jgi:magnesium-transporting ATPase (P-type)
VICYFFFKNMAISATVVLYTSSSGFSGNTLYDDMAFAAYNVAFTAFPVIVLGLFEQDTDATTSLRHPPLYRQGPEDQWLNKSRFLW